MESMNESRSIRVIIADDQELVRAGFAMVIGSQPDMEVVGQASDGAQAVALAESLHPDVVLMDVRMPGMDGIEATSRITSLSAAPGDAADSASPAANATISAESADDRPTRVIILTTFDLDEYVMAAINAGASGFLLKDTEPETLLNSIRTVFQGNAIIAPSATMTVHPVRMNGLVLGVPQTLSYFDRMQERIVRFVTDNSGISSKDFRRLMMNTGELVMDVGTVLDGEKAVQAGLIDHLGGLSEAISCLYRMIEKKEKGAKSAVRPKKGGRRR